MEPTIFRCPYEVQGIKDGTIIVVTLFGNRAMRLRLMRDALSILHADRSRSSVRFILPTSVMAKCDSFTLLQKRLLPYQIEYLTASLDCGLEGHLPHHSFLNPLCGSLRWRRRYHRMGARELVRELLWFGKPWHDLRGFCRGIFAWAKANAKEGVRYPEMILGTLVRDKRKYYTFQMDLSAFAIYQDQNRLHEPAHNDALFSIVKSPLYPEAFGRYSSRVEIVVTRDVDVAMLPLSVKLRLRRQSNAIHAAYGIRIDDLDSHQVGLGYWNLDDEKDRCS